MENLIIYKKFKFGKKEYYDLLLDNKLIGKAWITTKFHYLKNGLYIEIIPEMRNKGYGTKIYNLLLEKLSNYEVETVFMWVNKRNKTAINFFNKVTNKYETKFKIFNYIIFSETLMIEN